MFWEYAKAFLVGGVICLIGQQLIDWTKLTPARILVGYVVAGVILSAVGLYGPLADWAGCGASVPLTGFGHMLAHGFHFLGHGHAGRGNMVTLAKLNADTGIDHVFPAAEGTADTEHGVFIRTGVSTDSGRIGATVIAIASGEVPLIIRVEIKRMESR